MNIYIPKLGDDLVLAKDWSFDLYNEYRNTDFIKKIDDMVITYDSMRDGWRWPEEYHAYMKTYPRPFTLPSGTILTVDRVYIRKGAGNYDSVTFRIKKGNCPDPIVYGRFWAKLDDVNTMEVSVDED